MDAREEYVVVEYADEGVDAQMFVMDDGDALERIFGAVFSLAVIIEEFVKQIVLLFTRYIIPLENFNFLIVFKD